MSKIARAVIAALAALGIALGAAAAASPDMHYHGSPTAMHYHG